MNINYVSFSLGYYKQVDETAHTIDKNGWLHTGDVGFIDDEENVFIIDRIKELIKYKGFQVSLIFPTSFNKTQIEKT